MKNKLEQRIKMQANSLQNQKQCYKFIMKLI